MSYEDLDHLIALVSTALDLRDEVKRVILKDPVRAIGLREMQDNVLEEIRRLIGKL